MAVEILCGRSSGLPNAGALYMKIDATLSQDHEYRNKITSYPVENGLDITDHIRQEPDEVKIEGIISDTPDSVDSFDSNWSASMYETLCMIAGRGFPKDVSSPLPIAIEYPQPILVDIIVKLRVFTDMILENLVVPFTPTTGDTLPFTAHFKKVRKVDVSLSNVNYTSTKRVGQNGADRAQPNSDQGKQQTPNPNQANTDAATYLRAHWLGFVADLVGG
jgi:hypothetical protein